MYNKYVKMRSITWWSGFIPLICGLFIATVELHEAYIYVNTMNALTGFLPPSVMIVYGLTAIGLRGKDG